MKGGWPIWIALVLLLMGFGPPLAIGADPASGARSPGYYRENAAALEEQGDLPRALFAWRVVAALCPGDDGVAEKIQSLARAIAEAATGHYQQGVAHFQAGEMEKARHEFLVTLRLDPGHVQALFYLKQRLSSPDWEAHTVRRGESYGQIAADYYNDPSQAAIIAYFNDLDPGKPLRIDTLLLLPSPSDRRVPPRHDIAARRAQAQRAQRGIQALAASDQKLRLAQERFNQGAYEATITICQQVLEENPVHPKAQSLSDAAHYALGKQYLDQGDEARAIETLKVLGGDYNDTAQLLAQAQGRLNARAEEYYRKGVKHFLNEELEEAIAAWKNALSLNPNHPKARQDMDNAMRLLDKWRGLEKDDKKGQ